MKMDSEMDRLVGTIVWFELGSTKREWGFVHAISENEKYVYVRPFDKPTISHGLHVTTRGDYWGFEDDSLLKIVAR